MKNERQWRACDRCGKEIKVKPISEFEFMPIGDYFTPSPILKIGT